MGRRQFIGNWLALEGVGDGEATEGKVRKKGCSGGPFIGQGEAVGARRRCGSGRRRGWSGAVGRHRAR